MALLKNFLFLAFMAACLLATLVNAQLLEGAMDAVGGAADMAGNAIDGAISGPMKLGSNAAEGMADMLNGAADLTDPDSTVM